MSRAGALPHLLFVMLCTASLAALHFLGFAPLLRAEVAVQDMIARAGRPAAADPALVFLARDTDSASLETGVDLEQLFDLSEATPEERRALELMAHEWPWSREVHALVLDRLMAAGARAVVLDFTFPKPSPNDAAFEAALEKYRDRVVVAGNIADDGAEVADAPAFTAPAANLIPANTPRDARVGFDNFWPDFDGVIRRVQFRWAVEHGVWHGAEDLSLAARALERTGQSGLIPAARDAYRMRFAGPPGTFPVRSIFELFVPAYWQRNYASGAYFRDKIVVIGAAGNWQHDEHWTPLGVMPGAELHLNAINSLLHPDFLRELPREVEALLVILAALCPALIRRLVRRPDARFAALLLGTAAWLGAVLFFYNSAGWIVPSFTPLLAFNLNGASGLFRDILLERRERTKLRRTLERYVSRNVVEELVDNPDQYNRVLGGEVRPVTILFSDIRGFTRIAAGMDSKALVAQLNEYFTAMVDCVFAHGGTLDKFIGDAVMAVWGNARSAGPATDARNAVACALAMRHELEKLNAGWLAAGRPEVKIGLGLNFGDVVVGNIGSASRMEFTVIGDAVNIAWRLQEYTKRAGTDIVLGANLAALLGEDFPTEPLPALQLPDEVTVACASLQLNALPNSAAARALAHTALRSEAAVSLAW